MILDVENFWTFGYITYNPLLNLETPDFLADSIFQVSCIGHFTHGLEFKYEIDNIMSKPFQYVQHLNSPKI